MSGLRVTVPGVWRQAYARLAALVALSAIVLVLPGTLAAQPAELLAGAAVAVTALLVVAAVAGQLASRPRLPGHDPAIRGRLLRERARRRAVPRQIDPDAPGRSRPRAPSTRPSAA